MSNNINDEVEELEPKIENILEPGEENDEELLALQNKIKQEREKAHQRREDSKEIEERIKLQIEAEASQLLSQTEKKEIPKDCMPLKQVESEKETENIEEVKDTKPSDENMVTQDLGTHDDVTTPTEKQWEDYINNFKSSFNEEDKVATLPQEVEIVKEDPLQEKRRKNKVLHKIRYFQRSQYRNHILFLLLSYMIFFLRNITYIVLLYKIMTYEDCFKSMKKK